MVPYKLKGKDKTNKYNSTWIFSCIHISHFDLHRCFQHQIKSLFYSQALFGGISEYMFNK